MAPLTILRESLELLTYETLGILEGAQLKISPGMPVTMLHSWTAKFPS